MNRRSFLRALWVLPVAAKAAPLLAKAPDPVWRTTASSFNWKYVGGGFTVNGPVRPELLEAVDREMAATLKQMNDLRDRELFDDTPSVTRFPPCGDPVD